MAEADTMTQEQTDNNMEATDEVEYVHVAGEDVLPLPLDRGYAWVITFACMMNSFIVDGIANSFGLLLADFCEHFDASKSSVTLIGSLLCGVYLLMGPIVGPLVNMFGCRPVCMVGSVVSAAAFVASSFSTNLTMLTLTYGVLGGVGFGLVYLPSMVCVNFYFEKHRPLAMGLAVCGTGIGTIVMGPVTKILLQSMGWQNTLVILGGIALNAGIMGALMRPNEPAVSVEAVNKSNRRHKISIGESTQQNGQSGDPNKIDALAVQYVKRGRGDSEGLLPRKYTVNDASEKRRSESACAPLFISSASGVNHEANAESMLRSMPSIFDKRKKARGGTVDSIRNFDIQAVPTGVSSAALADLKRPLYRKDIFYSGSVMNLGGMQIQRSHQALSPSLLMLSMTRIPGEGTVTEGKPQKLPPPCLRCLPRSIVDAFLLMTDTTILNNPSFAVIWLGNLVCMMAFYVPLFFVTDFAREIGVSDDQGKYLNSAFGAANTIGRILVGFVAGHPKVSELLVNNLSMALCCLLSFMLNLCNGFISLLIVYTLFGVALAPIITLTSEILCSFVGLDKLTNAFGFIILARGLSTCIGSPLTAALYNEKTRYMLPFVVGGALFGASFFIFSIAFLPVLRRRQQRTRSQIEHSIRSVQNLSASLLLVEGTQLMVSSVDLSSGAQKVKKQQADADSDERKFDQSLYEATV